MIMERLKMKELVARAVFDERFDSDIGTTTLYYIVPKEALDEEFLSIYPDAEMACISLEFDSSSIPNPHEVYAEISPTREESDGSMLDYNWTDIGFEYSDIEKLLDKEGSSRPYLLISVCEGEIVTERFRYIEEARKCMLAELADAAEVAQEDFPDKSEYENVDYEWGYSLFDDCAYVRDGVNHDNYDWRIIKLF